MQGSQPIRISFCGRILFFNYILQANVKGIVHRYDSCCCSNGFPPKGLVVFTRRSDHSAQVIFNNTRLSLLWMWLPTSKHTNFGSDFLNFNLNLFCTWKLWPSFPCTAIMWADNLLWTSYWRTSSRLTLQHCGVNIHSPNQVAFRSLLELDRSSDELVWCNKLSAERYSFIIKTKCYKWEHQHPKHAFPTSQQSLASRHGWVGPSGVFLWYMFCTCPLSECVLEKVD